MYCKPKSTDKTSRVEVWSYKKKFLRFNYVLVEFLLNNLSNDFAVLRIKDLTSLERIAELQGKQIIKNLFAGFVKLHSKTICSISEGNIFEQSKHCNLFPQLVVFCVLAKVFLYILLKVYMTLSRLFNVYY